ncbi:MAG: metalloregulator ArsR/SmtB family transcription factor [Patescibacteria group bacterium]
MSKKPENKLAQLFSALGDDNRLRILKYLSSGEKCVCQIHKDLKLPQNLASHHLGKLKQCGCVCTRKKGRWVHYSLNQKRIKELYLFLNNITQKKS